MMSKKSVVKPRISFSDEQATEGLHRNTINESEALLQKNSKTELNETGEILQEVDDNLFSKLAIGLSNVKLPKGTNLKEQSSFVKSYQIANMNAIEHLKVDRVNLAEPINNTDELIRQMKEYREKLQRENLENQQQSTSNH